MILEETIAAISTAPGSGAIAIVRMSGKDAFAIAKKIFRRGVSSASDLVPEFKSHLAMHGFLQDLSEGKLIDEVVVIPFKAPNSFTGEDLVEINCHGGQVITGQVLALCLAQGARTAKPGEFTQRAFLNGRIDLTQAEAVLDVIQAKTGLQSRFAVSALQGELGGKIKAVRELLMELLSRVVAGIDFPEEVGDLPLDDLTEITDAAIDQLSRLLKTARSGRYLRDGVKVAIAGKPNAGKSSLLNQLLQFERAIVTDIPGTTRDSLEEQLDIDGIPVVLIDTAGVRSTEDQVEKIGIGRTESAIERSDLVLFVVDTTSSWNEEDELVSQLVRDKAHFLLGNKVDLCEQFSFNEIEYKTNSSCLAKLTISAKTGQGVEQLTSAIVEFVFNDPAVKDAGGSLNERQAELCQRALNSLALVRQTAMSGMPQDCLATDLKIAIDNLYEVNGEKVSEEIITNVFAKFCIGK